jgi:hypothetical protein
VDEKIQTAREAVPYHCQTIPQSTEPKKSHPQHLTIARQNSVPPLRPHHNNVVKTACQEKF